MSAVLALLAARKANARVFVRDGRLVIQSPEQLPTDVMAGLREHRDRLLEILLLPSSEQDELVCRICRRPQHEPDKACGKTASTYEPWMDPTAAALRVWYPGTCSRCGRPMHDGDYVCPTPEVRDQDRGEVAA